MSSRPSRAKSPRGGEEDDSLPSRKRSGVERLWPFSKSKVQLPANTGPSICFDVIKINKVGKRQTRKLNLSSAGVSNMSGSTVQWFLTADDVHSVAPDPSEPKSFVLTALHRYNFEAETPAMVDRVVEAFKMLNLGVGMAEKQPREEESTGKKMAIGDWELLKVIGKGSFGKVMQVKKKDNGKIYALKVLKKSELLKRNQVDHTKTEKAILATIDHPFMVRLHYSFQNEDKLYMVLDYVNGGELFFHLRRAGRFPEELSCFYIAEVISAIDYLHGRDIIYRDLKPENILLDHEGHVKITDFGLSKTGITSVGGKAEGHVAKTFCGTPEYLAPEIITGIGHGKAVDWWSVGILLYEMLTGTPPFYSQNRNEMYLNTIKGELEFPSYVSTEAKSILRGLLVRRPEERLGSGNAGAQEIKSHPFFRSINWKDLQRREIPPPFKPRVKDGIMDTSNFDSAFTSEPAVDSIVPTNPYSKAAAGAFTNFEFNIDEQKGKTSS